ncbi:uridine diphosphate-N-acetylglucosamine-binding protein YvcK [Epidermidibacterium keratini]|uniref:Putative gluconeogenesis factor n=1 Tax=Epidermidibacterium keratini TaxID=1891644 RepID=A0A7L4YU96_9ACTN|nr:uridine diphosphate-N-acetylglucosamine-binding protein YvcK [Epidermidibacterium keratini]
MVGHAVALGGGHGLAVTLGALRQVASEITAVVTVGDDGGSSGRIRREMPVLPPGDLRMALAALAGERPEHRLAARFLQHRFGGDGTLAGHNLGNLMITGLTEVLDGDTVAALDAVGQIAGAVGRVVPMSLIPLDLVAIVSGLDDAHPTDTRRVRGQVAVATTKGRVEEIELQPASPPACPEACKAIEAADAIIFGPGSWFTSVLPHLLVPDLRDAVERSDARRYLTLNLAPQPGETTGFTAADLLRAFTRHAPRLRLDGVIADVRAAEEDDDLTAECGRIGAELISADLSSDNPNAHDVERYAALLRAVFGPTPTHDPT